MSVIIASLQENITLQGFSLVECPLDDLQIAGFTEALPLLIPSLRYLDFYGLEGCGIQGMAALANQVFHHHNLETLSLQHCNLRDHMLERLAPSHYRVPCEH